MTDTRDVREQPKRLGLMLTDLVNKNRPTPLEEQHIIGLGFIEQHIEALIESALEAERKRIKVALEEEVRAILKEESGDE
jgi:hypothetical protein